ncbi:MAG TPA: branched-chain amino acid ABC transporter substrate-binding protein [Candidatus Competibacteraceae bacterium]|nr:branched-chain amino acid ABC transporter substrate-binding protein [Candidatus Competibacteraceae bacterium]
MLAPQIQKPRLNMALAAAWGAWLAFGLAPSWASAQEVGVTDKIIRIGSTTQLEGEYKYFGQSQKQGMTAALNGQTVQKHAIEFTQVNDFYEPAKAVEGAKQLIEKGIFAMVLSGGTGTAKAVLPVLAEHKIPAFGFYNGAGFTGPGDVLNFRVSYAKEVEIAADTGISMGLKPTEICAYVQNDPYGMSGLSGLRASLAKHPGTEAAVAKLDQILNMPGDNPARNNIGPVGVYKRDTSNAREGYMSLKKWETEAGVRCRLVVTTALYNQAVNFIAYVIQKGEPWIFSSVSAASGDLLASLLKEKAVKNKVIFTTQVVPPLESPLPVVAEARKALSENLNVISLESYMVGKLFVMIMQTIDGPLTRENFLKAARRQPYDLGGLKVDFTTDNQGSDYVGLTALKDERFAPVTAAELAALIK